MDNPDHLPLTYLDWNMERVGKKLVLEYWEREEVREEFEAEFLESECVEAVSAYMRMQQFLKSEKADFGEYDTSKKEIGTALFQKVRIIIFRPSVLSCWPKHF